MNSSSPHPSDPSALIDASGQVHAPAGEGARIVSLVPSLTELVCDLGLRAQLVGRTGFCVHPREVLRDIPKVGGTKDVRLEVVRALAPTHLLVNVDENTRETVAELARFVPHVIVTHPCTPADNLTLFRLLGGVFGREALAAELCASLEAALLRAAELRRSLDDETVAYLIWREPWMTVARSTYISAMLAAVGWQTAPASSELRYPVFSWADMTSVARVFLSTEPYHFKPDDLAEISALAAKPAHMIDGEMVSWYGSRAIAGLDYLVALRRSLALEK